MRSGNLGRRLNLQLTSANGLLYALCAVEVVRLPCEEGESGGR
jgi:hypothetical protein